MSDGRPGYCMVCREDNVEVRHIPLYVIGSEGLVVCHACEMKVVEFVRSLMRETSVYKLQSHLESRSKKE
jgi:hypothetical protein